MIASNTQDGEDGYNEERFESCVLPLFARKSKEVAHLIPELYLRGLAEGDLDLALRGL